MFRKIIQRITANPKKRIYVVIGEQLQRFEEPAYSTDPKYFGFDVYDLPTTSPDHFPPLLELVRSGVRPSAIIKVFRTAGDAVEFANCCNLDNVIPLAYDRINGTWVRSENQTAFDIEW